MKALERAMDSCTNRAAFKRAGLVINPAVIPLTAMVKRDELLALIAESQLPNSAPSACDDADLDSGRGPGRGSIFAFLNRELFEHF
jgi:hypothetical protein